MEKLTKKIVKENIYLMEGEKIIDIDIYAEGGQANVIVLTKHHNVEFYSLHLLDNKIYEYMSIMKWIQICLKNLF